MATNNTVRIIPLYINKYVDLIENIMLKYVKLPEDVVYSPATRQPIPIKDVVNPNAYSTTPYYSFICLRMVESIIQIDLLERANKSTISLFKGNPLVTTLDADRISFYSSSVYEYIGHTIDEIIRNYIEEITPEDESTIINLVLHILDIVVAAVDNKFNNIYYLDYDYSVILLQDNGEIGTYRLLEFESQRALFEIEYEERSKDVYIQREGM